jgi:proteasome accessory factor B
VARILRIIRTLDRVGGCDLYELASTHNTTTRTIRRDLQAIEEAGIPLHRESGEGPKVRWSFVDNTTKHLSTLFEASHYLALRLAMEESTILRVGNTSLFGNLEDLADAIEKAVGPKGKQQLLELEACFFSWDKFVWRNAPRELLFPLMEAIPRHRLCQVTYQAPSSGNAEKKYRVLPLKLIVHNGSLYLHAWQRHFKTVLILNLNRLHKLEVLDEIEAVPPEYDPEKLASSAFGIFLGPKPVHYTLHFDAYARPYIEERKWHQTERLEPQPDGSLLLHFDCTPSYEVTNWVASWRKHVQVVEPKPLRKELREYAKWLLAGTADED